MLENFPSSTIEKGQQYFHTGRVRAVFVLDGRMHALVSGSQMYHCWIDLKGENNGCSCPMEISCKHVVAAVLSYENEKCPDIGNILDKLDGDDVKATLKKILIKYPESAKMVLGAAKPQKNGNELADEVFEGLLEGWGDPEYGEIFERDVEKLKGDNDALLYLLKEMQELQKERPLGNAFQDWWEDACENGEINNYEPWEVDDLGVEFEELAQSVIEQMNFNLINDSELTSLKTLSDWLVRRKISELEDVERAERLMKKFFGADELISFYITKEKFDNAKELLENNKCRLSNGEVCALCQHFAVSVLDFLPAEALDMAARSFLRDKKYGQFKKTFSKMNEMKLSYSDLLLKEILCAEPDKDVMKIAAKRYLAMVSQVYCIEENLLSRSLCIYPEEAKDLISGIDKIIQMDAACKPVTYSKTMAVVAALKNADLGKELEELIVKIMSKHSKRLNLTGALKKQGYI